MWDAIKKFGLQHCDLPTMLGNVAFMLRAMALNIDIRNKTPIPWYVYIICLMIAFGYFYVYLISMLWYVSVWYPKSGDLLSALVIFSLGISSEIGTVKLAFMIFYIKEVKQIVADTLACDASVVPRGRFSNNVMKTMRYVKKRAMVFWIVIILNGVVYIVKPILTPGRHYPEDRFILIGLEPKYETPNFEIAFAMMTVGVIFTCYLPANITAFLIIITGYIEAQMLALSIELLSLREDAEEHYLKTKQQTTDNHDRATVSVNVTTDKHKIVNEYVQEHLKDIIKIHGRNINLLHQVENVFSGPIVVEFFLLIIGLIAELLGGLENTYIQMPFALMQVGMDCFTGQRVMDASIIFEKAVYASHWEHFDKENMKIVQIMLQSSQKTMKLSAGGILMLSFNCLMLIIRSIYSAYATLRTIMT